MLTRAKLLLVLFVFIAGLARAQTSPSNSTTQNPASPPSSESAPKVWTNDDLAAIPAHPGPAKRQIASQANRPATRNAAPPKPFEAQRYRNQLARLHAQVADLDPQIAALQAAIGGKSTDEPRKYGWLKPGSYPDELTALQTKRANLLHQISDLEDQARHAGVSPGSLR